MQKIVLALLACFHFFQTTGALKEVQFSWNDPFVRWGDQVNYVPCLEPFQIKIINCPAGTTRVQISIYQSSGKNLFIDVSKGTLLATYNGAVGSVGTEYLVLVSQKLSFKRFYYVEVSLTTSSLSSTTTSGVAPTRSSTTSTANPSASISITTTISTVVVPPAVAAVAAPGPITTTTTEIITVERKESAIPVYAIPFKSELSRLEFLGGIGAAEFSQPKFQNLDHNIGFVTGLKIKLRPVSSNPDIGRFGLYPRASRWSFIIGTVLNDLNYKSSNIKASVFGLKPILGIDFEFGNGALGLSSGVIIGDQDTGSKLNNNKSIVTGLFFGLSLSSDVFQALRKNIPASQNFPNTQGQ